MGICRNLEILEVVNFLLDPLVFRKGLDVFFLFVFVLALGSFTCQSSSSILPVHCN